MESPAAQGYIHSKSTRANYRWKNSHQYYKDEIVFFFCTNQINIANANVNKSYSSFVEDPFK